MVSPVVLIIQICLIQYALSQRINTQTMSNVHQFRNNARNIQLQGQITPEAGPIIETSTKIPVVPNQQINQTPSMVPSSNDFLLTNLGLTKTTIPRTTLNEGNTQLEGQIATQGLVKDTLAKVPTVPKTTINPYKPLLPNNNAFMNPSMANIGLGIGVARQPINGAGMPNQYNGAGMPSQYNSAGMPSQYNAAGMPSQYNGVGMPSLTGIGMPNVAYGGSGTGEVGVTGELPVNGMTSVKGQVPLTGKVSFNGNVPCGGIVTISGSSGTNANKVPYAQGPYGNKIYGY